MKKFLGTVLSASLLSALITIPVQAAEFTVMSTTPADGEKMVSVIEDVVITFSQEVDAATLADGITVSGDKSYRIKKSKDKVTILFDSQLDYLTDYTIMLDEDLKALNGTALTPCTFTFKTEYDPIKTLFYEDFENGADSLANFTLGTEERAVTQEDGFYTIIEDPNDPHNHILQMTKPANGFSADFGYYPIFKGSSTWKWYTADYDLTFKEESTKVNFLMKGAGYGVLDASKQRDVIEHYMVNTNYTQVLSKRENAVAGNWNTFAHLQSAQSGKCSKSFPSDTTVAFTGSANKSKISYTFAGVTTSKLQSNGTDVDVMYTVAGASGIAATQGTATVDNIVVTDTGWYPSVAQRKNITDTVVMGFNTALTAGSLGKDSITVTTLDGEKIPVTVTLKTDYPRNVTITLLESTPNTTYIVKVPVDSVKTGNPDPGVVQGLSNDKIFTIKTAYEDFSAEQTTPADNETNVNVNSAVTVKFSKAVNFDTLTDNITITNAPSFTIQQIDEQTAQIIFDSNLNYSTEYTVELSDAILSEDGSGLTSYSFKFTTQASNFGLACEADGKSDIAVIDDIILNFNEDIDWNTMNNSNITVTPNAEFSVLKVDEQTAKIAFKDALQYFTDYKITVGSNVISAGGVPVSQKVITFKTAPDMGKALFYENFDGEAQAAYDRFEEAGSANRHESENFSVEDGAMKLPSWYSGSTNQAEKTMPLIKGSQEWKNYEVQFDSKIPSLRDISTGVGASVSVGMRYGTYGSVTSYIEALYADSLNNGIIDARVYRNGQGSTTDPYVQVTGVESGTYDWTHTKVSIEGIQNSAKVNYELTVDGNTYRESFDSAAKPSDFKEAYIITNGGVIFSTTANTRASYVDNILVNDLDFYFTIDKVKNNDGTIVMNFNKPLNMATAKDYIKVYDENAEPIDAALTVGENKVTVKIDNPESGMVYRVTALKDLQSTTGERMICDRYTDVSVLLDFAVMNLDIKSGTDSIKNVTENAEIYGSCGVYYDGQETKTVTLILAVYDENGVLYSVKFNKQNISNGTTSMITEKITLPSDVQGYTASVFCWDDLANIKPVSSSYTIN